MFDANFASPVPRGRLAPVNRMDTLKLRSSPSTASPSPQPQNTAEASLSPCFITPSPQSRQSPPMMLNGMDLTFMTEAGALTTGGKSYLSSKSPEGVSTGDRAPGLSLCEVAMDLVTLLDADSMAYLEKKMANEVPSDQFVKLVMAAIEASVSRGEAGSFGMRDSEKNFQGLLRRSLIFDEETVEFIAASIKSAGGDIAFTSFMDFLVNAGRRVPAADDMVSTDDVDADRREGSHANIAGKRFDTQEVDLSAHLAAETGYTQVIPVPGHNCFAAAALRYIEFIDEKGEPCPTMTTRINMPSDPGATIASICLAPEINEIVVGLNNSKVMCFNFEGKVTRSALIFGVPAKVGWDKPRLRSEEHDTTGIVHCGTRDGTLYGLTLPAKGVLRVSFGTRLGNGEVTNIVGIPSQSLMVCSCQKSVFVCCAMTGALKQRPIVNSGTVRALAYHPRSGGVVYAHDGACGTVFFLSKRTLRSTGNGAAEMKRGGCREPIYKLAADPCSTHNVTSVDAAGNVLFWNVTTLSPCGVTQKENSSPTVCGATVVVAPGLSSIAASAELRTTLLVGKPGMFSLTRKSAVVAIREEEIDADGATDPVATTPLAILPCSKPHAVFFGGVEPSTSIIKVHPHDIELHNLLDGSVMFSYPASLNQHLIDGGRRRITAACFGPGKLMLLLGTESGALLVISIEPTSMGEVTVLDEAFAGCEVVQLHFFEALGILVAQTFDGGLIVAEVKLGHGRRHITSTPFPNAHSVVATAADTENNLLAVVDAHDMKLKLFYVCLNGDYLRADASAPVGDLLRSNHCVIDFLPSFSMGGSGTIAAGFRDTERTSHVAYYTFSGCGKYSKGIAVVHEACRGNHEGSFPTTICGEAPTTATIGMADGSVVAAESDSVAQRMASTSKPTLTLTVQRPSGSPDFEPVAATTLLGNRNVAVAIADQAFMLHLLPAMSEKGSLKSRSASPMSFPFSPSPHSMYSSRSRSPSPDTPSSMLLPPIVREMREKKKEEELLKRQSSSVSRPIRSATIKRTPLHTATLNNPRCQSASLTGQRSASRRSTMLEVLSHPKPQKKKPGYMAALPPIHSTGKFAF